MKSRAELVSLCRLHAVTQTSGEGVWGGAECFRWGRPPMLGGSKPLPKAARLRLEGLQGRSRNRMGEL